MQQIRERLENKMKKKILTMLVIVLVAFVFCACGSEPSPSDVAKDFLKAVKAQDSAAIEKLYVGESFFLEETNDAEDLPEGLSELLEEKMLAFVRKP